MLALENGDPNDDEDPDGQEGEESEDEDEAWKQVLGKAKRARDQCNSIKADCEAALEAAEKAYLYIFTHLYSVHMFTPRRLQRRPTGLQGLTFNSMTFWLKSCALT